MKKRRYIFVLGGLLLSLLYVPVYGEGAPDTPEEPIYTVERDIKEEVEKAEDTEQFPPIVEITLILMGLFGLWLLVSPKSYRSLLWSWYGMWGWVPDKTSRWQSIVVYRIGGVIVLIMAIIWMFVWFNISR